MVDCKNILYCLNLHKIYRQRQRPASNKNARLYQKTTHIDVIFTGQTGCGKTHLVLELIEKEYNKHFDYIVIICPTIRENLTHHAKKGIKNDDQVWLIEPKDNLYQWNDIRIITTPRGTIYHR